MLSINFLVANKLLSFSEYYFANKLFFYCAYMLRIIFLIANKLFVANIIRNIYYYVLFATIKLVLNKFSCYK